MYAVIKTGGKQYRVAANDNSQDRKAFRQAGDTVEFADVLMVANGDSLEFGAPFVAGATVAAEIVGQVRGPKIIIFKKRRRKHYRRRNGHRQDLTQVRITEILTGGAKPSKKEKAAAKPAEIAPLAAPIEGKPADDLSLIGGVGPKILKTLTEMGYTTYAPDRGARPATRSRRSKTRSNRRAASSARNGSSRPRSLRRQAAARQGRQGSQGGEGRKSQAREKTEE